jgi:hypothetical protein
MATKMSLMAGSLLVTFAA